MEQLDVDVEEMVDTEFAALCEGENTVYNSTDTAYDSKTMSLISLPIYVQGSRQ